MAYKNYSNDYDNLNSWLSRVPNYEPHETDDTRQVETKLKNQRVSVMNSRAVYILHIAGAKEYSAAKKSLYQLFCFLQNLLSDIVRKESDLNNISKNAQLYQQAVKVRVLHITIFHLQKYSKIKAC